MSIFRQIFPLIEKLIFLLVDNFCGGVLFGIFLLVDIYFAEIIRSAKPSSASYL